jgi:hypothetical protein
MSKFPHDEFVKEYIPELCSEYGVTTPSMPVNSETREIDVFFQPNAAKIKSAIKTLGLLGKIIQTPCLLEFYRNAINETQIRECISKLLDVQQKQIRQAKRENQKIAESEISRLWIITPTISKNILAKFEGKAKEKQEKGIYFLAEGLFTGIIAVHQLEVNQETLWLRVLGRGKVQSSAIEELKSVENQYYQKIILELVYKLLENLELNKQKSTKIHQEDEELIMTLRTTFRDKLVETEQKGMEKGLEKGVKETLKNNIISILEKRFNSIPFSLITQIQKIEDIPHLQRLLLETISINSLDDFQDLL